MPRTIQCTQCGVVLNLPDSAAGKRLKCPKCGCKFQVSEDISKYPSTEMSSHDAGPTTSQITAFDHGDDSLPTSAGNLRETFDLPMLSEVATANPSASVVSKAQVGDALALFEDNKAAPRRKTAAEARAQTRRCKSCGGVVPAGMSICSMCGVDQETGHRVGFDDDDMMPEAPQRLNLPPIPAIVIGGTCLLGSIIMGIGSAVQWYRREPGWVYFVPLCAFAIYAAVQFLRGKTARLLLIALTLGAMVDVVAMIALPIYNANMETNVIKASQPVDDDPDRAEVEIASVAERLDQQKLTTGVVLLLVYAAAATYLMSGSVRRSFARQ